MPDSRAHADIGAQIDLVSAVQALRAQITEAAATDPGSDIRFQVRPIGGTAPHGGHHDGGLPGGRS
ncbi:trypco2 family protein [Streptomyces sp. NPDC004296]|uniref:trypco2 family protein n=1 Tax=Streptomyces sp. NPDC004296 TaxID=3364697 RepID=UPI0036C1A8D0